MQRDGTVTPQNKRSFTASGRRRWQHDLLTMERKIDEEKEYDIELSAIEISSDDGVLYTATRKRLYREDLGAGPPTPATPHDAWVLHTGAEDRIIDVKVMPSPDHDQGIFVLSREFLIVLSYDPATGSFTQENAIPRPAGFFSMTNLELHQNAQGRWRAYVMGITGSPTAGPTRGLVVCKIGNPTGPSPNYSLEFITDAQGTVWDPRLNEQGQFAYSAGCHNLVLRNEGGTTRAYVACGFDRQVTVLDVMYAHENASHWTHELDPASPPKSVLDRIVLEQNTFKLDTVKGITWSPNPAYLTVLDQDDIWTVDPNHGPGFPVSTGGYGFGEGAYDLAVVDFGPPAETTGQIWSQTKGSTSFHMKRFQLDPTGVPYATGLEYGMSTADGAVAIPDPIQPQNAVIFAPNMGGIVKFTTADATEPQTFTVDVDSYQNSVPVEGGMNSTEQIALGNLGTAAAPGPAG